ncbi:MAG: GvpL/GvpF family gas vesicle protein, partial [Rubrimonas sp.]
MIGRLRFLAVMGASAAIRAAEAPWGREAGLRVFAHEDLAAVFAPGRETGPLARLSLRPPVPEGARIEILRRLSLGGAVLPAAPAATLGPLSAAPALAANADFLRDALARMKGRVQRRVIVAWNRAEALRRHADDPELTVAMGACADAIARRSAENQGLLILRERLAALYALQLMAVCEDAVAGTPASADVVLDMLCLIEPAMGPAFEATLDAIGDAWTEGLTIVVGGPAPATGFVALDFKAPADAALDAAALALGVGDPRATSPEAVDAAFRARAGGLGPLRGDVGQVDAL